MEVAEWKSVGSWAYSRLAQSPLDDVKVPARPAVPAWCIVGAGVTYGRTQDAATVLAIAPPMPGDLEVYISIRFRHDGTTRETTLPHIHARSVPTGKGKGPAAAAHGHGHDPDLDQVHNHNHNDDEPMSSSSNNGGGNAAEGHADEAHIPEGPAEEAKNSGTISSPAPCHGLPPSWISVC